MFDKASNQGQNKLTTIIKAFRLGSNFSGLNKPLKGKKHKDVNL